MLLGRTLAILIGPFLGIVLGWWLSRRLVRTVAQIRVTLTGNDPGSGSELATVQFSQKDDLAVIQAQVETVLERLRRTAIDLQQAPKMFCGRNDSRPSAVSRREWRMSCEIR